MAIRNNIELSVAGNQMSVQQNANNILEDVIEVDNTDGFIDLINMSTTKGANNLDNIKSLTIQNTGSVCAELQFVYQEWKNNSNTDDANSVDTGGGATVNRYATMLLPAGEFVYLPHGRLIGYNADASAANATSISNTAPAPAAADAPQSLSLIAGGSHLQSLRVVALERSHCVCCSGRGYQQWPVTP